MFVTSSGGISFRYPAVTTRHLSMSLYRPGVPGAVKIGGADLQALAPPAR
ncbi:MAG TPA: hypothetical protein VG253_24195 [Streptosporangiaceae bacterium]|nr:hypothetical protein [Streptosporangiaceae bacterium]